MAKTKQPDPKGYLWIQAWGKYMSDSQEWIDLQVQLATQECAPAHALYRRPNGKWATTGSTIYWDSGFKYKRLKKLHDDLLAAWEREHPSTPSRNRSA